MILAKARNRWSKSKIEMVLKHVKIYKQTIILTTTNDQKQFKRNISKQFEIPNEKIPRYKMASSAKTVSVSVDKLAPSEPSLCIPFVFGNITRKRVIDALNDVGLGEIERIDMVRRANKKGDKGFMVYIHFKRWGTNENACAAREMVLSGEMFQVTYDDPWFWKIGMSHAKKPERRAPKKKASVSFTKKSGTGPKLSIRTPKSGPTKKDIELARIKNEKEMMRRELEELRAFKASQATGGATTPYYCPSSPVFAPTSPGGTPTFCPPELSRQTGADSFTLGTPDHLAREAEEEISGGAAAC